MVQQTLELLRLLSWLLVMNSRDELSYLSFTFDFDLLPNTLSSTSTIFLWSWTIYFFKHSLLYLFLFSLLSLSKHNSNFVNIFFQIHF